MLFEGLVWMFTHPAEAQCVTIQDSPMAPSGLSLEKRGETPAQFLMFCMGG